VTASPTTPAGVTASTPPALGGPASSTTTGTGPCQPLNNATVAAVFTVAVGSQAFKDDEGGGYACLYGIGPNATIPGSKLPGARTDVMSATLVPSGGTAIYQSETANYRRADTFVTLTGVGDQAGYAYSSQLRNPPVIIAVRSDAFCDVSLNLASGSEVGLAASSGVGSVSPADAAGLAAKEARFCVDLFTTR
jgi:hypothetical protein